MEKWFALVCVFPMFVLAAVYTEAVAAVAALGHWPVPSLNDPKSLTTAPLHDFTALFAVPLPAVAVFVFAIAVRNWRVLRYPSRYWTWLAIFLTGCVTLCVVAAFDPGHVWEWWWD